MLKSWAAKQKGFTIVELLIVIVVIAILATISIVAYNGIQTRAENTKTVNGVAAYTKIFSMYATEKGEYPSASVFPCLDTTATAGCGRVAGSTGCNFSGNAPNSTDFYNQLTDYVKTLPSISSQTMSCSGQAFRGAYVEKNDTNTKNLLMNVFLKGSVDCPSTMGAARYISRQQADETTVCRIMMPSL